MTLFRPFRPYALLYGIYFPINCFSMNVKIYFGENLKFYRKERHLSQEQLSEKVDISVKHLSAIERGLTFVSADLLGKLSESLEVPVYLFFLKEAEIFDSEAMLNSIIRKVEKYVEKHVEKNLTKAIEEIKADIRQNKLKL